MAVNELMVSMNSLFKRSIPTLWLSFFLLAAIPGFSQIHFDNKAQELGIRAFKTDFSIGNGVSFVDFNQDGWDDITIGTARGKFIDFYINEAGIFKRIFPLVTHRDESKQINWIDFDNDGDLDLFVASYDGPNRLYENLGELKLEDITEQAGLPMNDEYTHGAIWGDYDRDGWLDLYFGTHKDVIPDKYNKLFRNRGDKTFTDVSEYTNTSDLNKVPFCSGFIDINNDKWPDIYTANDKLTLNTLLFNKGNGSFSSVADLANAELKMNAMCVNMGDFNNDGWQDIYITNTPVGNKLLRNDGPTPQSRISKFTEVAEQAGVAYYGHGWASNFLDADNDGDLDLYVSGMMKIEEMGNRTSVFYENLGDGTFSVPEAGMQGDSASSFVNAIGDANQDGYPDIAVQNNPPAFHHFWMNGGGENNWIKFNLEGIKSNRDAVGAKIEIYADSLYQMQYRNCGNGFMGQNSKTITVGCRDYTTIDSVVITWPTGHIDRFYDLNTQQTYFFQEGNSTNGIIEVDPEVRLTVTSLVKALPIRKMKLYPIPATDLLFIELPDNQLETAWIYHTSGQLVKQISVEATNQLKVSDLENGSYWVLVKGQNEEFYQGMFQKVN